MARLCALLLLTTPLAACGLFDGDGPEIAFSSAVAPDDESLVLGRDTVFVRPHDADAYWSLIRALEASQSLPPFSVEVLPGAVRIDGYFYMAAANRLGGSVRRTEDGVEITARSHSRNLSVAPRTIDLILYRAEAVPVKSGDRIRVVHQNDIYNKQRAGYPDYNVEDLVVLDTVLTTVP